MGVAIGLSALFLSVATLFLGNGLLSTLIPVRASGAEFSALVIGGIGAAYFFGFAAGCVVAPRFIAAVGHIRTFAAMAAVAAAAASLHSLIVEPVAWIVLRAATGVAFAGLYTVIESWLNERATNANRGSVFSLYLVINLSALMGGQQLMNLYPPNGHELFLVVAILVALGLIPVTLTRAQAPAPLAHVELSLKWLWRVSNVGVVGAIGVGLANGAFWSLGPVFAQEMGLEVSDVALFMSATVLGGALAQVPSGKISDRVDRRWVMIACGVGGVAAGVALAVVGGRAGADILFALAMLFGAFAFPLYGLSIAHANDRAATADFVRVGSGLLLVYGVAGALGGLLGGEAIALFGPTGLYAYTALVHALTAGFVFYRIRKEAPVVGPDKGAFVDTPRTSAAIFELDPRKDESASEVVPADRV